jgi:hypothetical protein
MVVVDAGLLTSLLTARAFASVWMKVLGLMLGRRLGLRGTGAAGVEMLQHAMGVG